jgi:uncharacterized protein (TIGR03086 family)
MDVREAHRQAKEYFAKNLEQVAGDQWDLETPCDGWSVKELVQHVAYGNRWVTPLVEGKTIDEVGDALEGDALGDDPVGSWRRTADEAQAAFDSEGAMETTVHLSFGDFPGQEYANQRFFEFLIHGWDVAKATGGDTNLDSDLVDTAYAWAKPLEGLLAGSGGFGTEKVEVPPGADRQTELLALSGRKA